MDNSNLEARLAALEWQQSQLIKLHFHSTQAMGQSQQIDLALGGLISQLKDFQSTTLKLIAGSNVFADDSSKQSIKDLAAKMETTNDQFNAAIGDIRERVDAFKKLVEELGRKFDPGQ